MYHDRAGRVKLAAEFERFADRLRDNLGMTDVAADLYKAALDLRREEP